ncbi:MAG: nucleotidyltransferase family protein [candidate division Zixibacteria bacterium]
MQPTPSVGIVILAAGESKRLGQPKQLLPYRGTTLLGHVIGTALASQACQTVVVLGAYAESIRNEIGKLPITIVENSNYRGGMATSIALGIATLEQSDIVPSAALLTTCDQPYVSSDLIDKMIVAYSGEPDRIVACKYDSTVGVPALFDRSCFAELKRLQGDHGARSVIESHSDHLVTVDFPKGSVDIDRIEDVDRSL